MARYLLLGLIAGTVAAGLVGCGKPSADDAAAPSSGAPAARAPAEQETPSEASGLPEIGETLLISKPSLFGEATEPTEMTVVALEEVAPTAIDAPTYPGALGLAAEGEVGKGLMVTTDSPQTVADFYLGELPNAENTTELMVGPARLAIEGGMTAKGEPLVGDPEELLRLVEQMVILADYEQGVMVIAAPLPDHDLTMVGIGSTKNFPSREELEARSAKMQEAIEEAGSPAAALEAAKGKALTASCVSNVRQLCLALHAYMADYDDVLPGPEWTKAIEPYTKNPELLECPAGAQGEIGYALNAAVTELGMADIPRPAETVFVFESTAGGERPTGGPSDLAVRHEDLKGGQTVIGFVDGHVKTVSKEDAEELVWDPGQG